MPQVCLLRSVVNPAASALFPTQDLKKGVLGHIDVDPFFVSMAELSSVVKLSDPVVAPMLIQCYIC